MLSFIKEVLNLGKFEGCRYKYLDVHYAVVFTWDDEYGLLGKIAFNCSNSQSDYESDWLLPQTKSEETLTWIELAMCQERTAEDLAADFTAYYKCVLENDSGCVE